TATIEPENATNQQIVWSSSDDDVVIVSQDGVVEAISDGTATIKATTVDGNVTAECSVSINSSDVFFILNTIQWENAINSISQGSDTTNYTLMIVNDFEVSGTRVNTFGDRNDIYVTITGDQTISLSSDSTGHLLMIGDDTQITIVLNDIGLRGHFENDASLVYTGKNSIFVMQGPSSISGNRSGEFGGGGVDNKGVFTMKDHSSIFENLNEYQSGGYIHRNGGVFNSEEGVFTMTDNSSIYANTSFYIGGGVFNRGIFTMTNNSSISNNIANSSGGGVANVGGTFTMMENATISDNQAFARYYMLIYDGGGGGVVNLGNFFMSDKSSISGNWTYTSGGGVYNASIFVMSDNASILENTTDRGPGAFYNSYGSFFMSGNSRIHGNKTSGLGVTNGYVLISEYATISGNSSGVSIGRYPEQFGDYFIEFIMSGGTIYGTIESGAPEEFANEIRALSGSFFQNIIIKYGDDQDILPHIDGFPRFTNHTIYGRE
ncbi:MAG: Ig-like domain-containing protein, partial [Candidatus Cloacimonetes bacterium]|nr:Ig-like domain-containing protein [Candidatus Cloacimonadota bacterium]